jgi:hypothetical protein
MPVTILFLSANPSDARHLGVEDEAREIQRIFRRDARFEVKLAPAARVDDFQTWLLERPRPRVVHFSGHGARGGAAGTRGAIAPPVAPPPPGALLVVDDEGLAVSVSPSALARLFELLGGVCCVVLNACFSEEQARALTAHVDYVIGTTGEIDDRASIAFSKAFYEAIGAGEALQTAFELGRNAIVRNGLGRPEIVRDFYREGVKPEEIRLAEVREERAPFCVPFFQNPGFVGRADDLAVLHALLQEEKAAGVRPAALTGMGGIGKTQLAVEYAYRYRASYPGGVYWVNAAESWQGELASLAEHVGIREDSAPESDRQRRLAMAFLKYVGERAGALVVFDNVEDPRSLRVPLLGVIPAQMGCRLLFTSRRRDGSGSFRTIEVNVLPEEAALDLLLASEARGWIRAGGDKASLAEARAICRMLGCLPLALVLAGAYLGERPEIALADYRARLEEEGALAAVDAAGVAAEDLPTRHAAAVQATLDLQWKALHEEAAREVLRAAALLGEAAEIPRARLGLLTGLGDRATRGRSAPLADALRRLRELSLVEELTEHAIRLHPLVREFAEKHIAARETFAAACAERLRDALWDMGRLHEEVAARGIDGVLEDLRVGLKLAGRPGWARLEELIRPLDRESHCLRGWDPAREPGFLLQQLRNRCFEMGIGEVQAQAEARIEEQKWSWLRERIAASRESEALVRTLEGHNAWVTGVAVTSDGCFAVSASEDHTLKVWDLGTGQAVRTLQGHTRDVTGVAVTSDGRFVVSSSWDGVLQVWDLGTGQAVRTLSRNTSLVTGVAVTPDGRFAVSASNDQTLRTWDLETGQTMRVLGGHTSLLTGVAVTPDGGFAVSASDDHTLKVWSLETSLLIATLETHAPLACCAVTPDGKTILAGDDAGSLHILDWKGPPPP